MQSYDVDETGRRTPAKTATGHKASAWAPPHETGVVDGARIAGGAVLIVRLIALLLWAASLIGTYVPFAGGWEPVLVHPWPPSELAAALALGTQIPLSWAQWAFKSRAILWWRRGVGQTAMGWWAAYAVALIISAAFSVVTYGQWIAPILAGIGPTWAVWLIVGIAAILADMVPEWILIRD